AGDVGDPVHGTVEGRQGRAHRVGVAQVDLDRGGDPVRARGAVEADDGVPGGQQPVGQRQADARRRAGYHDPASGHQLITAWTVVISSSPSAPSSRPKPDSPNPPNGTAGRSRVRTPLTLTWPTRRR